MNVTDVQKDTSESQRKKFQWFGWYAITSYLLMLEFVLYWVFRETQMDNPAEFMFGGIITLFLIRESKFKAHMRRLEPIQ